MNVTRPSRSQALTTVIAAIVVLSMAVAGLAVPQADAAGPPYSGPQTGATGEAYFGPAPNPFPYCDNPTYFDPFPENVNPIGRIDVEGTPNASVTTNGVTMTFELTAEGNPDTQYPGFFPAPDGEGDATDQPKGVEMATGDEAIILLSEPLFYTQWVFTDVDRANEGFFVTPQWSDIGNPGEVAVFGGDANFTFAGTTNTEAIFNDTDTVGQDSEALEGRVQVDLLGAATGISLVRDTGSGQSGFAVGGGCEPLGVAKELTSGPTWNGTSYDVTYTIRVRNNLPSAATIGADIAAALAAAASGESTGTPDGIEMQQVTLSDLLTDSAFESVVVVSNVNTSGNVAVNPDYNGDDDVNLIAAGETIPAEQEEEFVLTLQYVPDLAADLGPTCSAQYSLENQATAGGIADGVVVVDLSDDGADPDPGVNNGGGGVDDPTPVLFDCPPEEPANPAISLSKTVLPGADADCTTAVEGENEFYVGVTGDPVTWCFVVTNTGDVPLTNIIFNDAPAGIADLDLLAGAASPVLAVGDSISFSEPGTIPENGANNVASVTADGSDENGTPLPDVPGVEDENTASISEAELTLSKTVVAGANADCSTSVEEVTVNAGSDVTYCFEVTNSGGVPMRVEEVVDVTLGVTIPIASVDQVMPPGTSLTVSYSTTADAQIVNVATVEGVPIDSTTGDPIPNAPTFNPEDPAGVDTLEADLSIVKSNGDVDRVFSGNIVPYTLVVTNDGPDEAVNVVVVDTLPAGLDFISLPDTAGWGCSNAGAVLTCNKTAPLVPGESATLNYSVQVAADAPLGQDMVNTATVGSDTPDPDPTDNEDTETTIRVPEPTPRPEEILPIVEITNPPGQPPAVTLVPPAPPLSVPPLAATGVSSGWLAFTSAAMTAAGAVLLIGGRRRSDDHR